MLFILKLQEMAFTQNLLMLCVLLTESKEYSHTKVHNYKDNLLNYAHWLIAAIR